MKPSRVSPGITIERLTALRPDPERRGHWFWRCECGAEKSIRVEHVGSLRLALPGGAP